MIDSNRPYRRTDFDKVLTKAKASMQQAALIRGGDGISFYQKCRLCRDKISGCRSTKFQTV